MGTFGKINPIRFFFWLGVTWENRNKFFLEIFKCVFFLFEGLAEWSTPKGGMFLWVKALGIQDTYKMLMEKGLQMKIMALPGRECMADKTKPCPYFRLSFSVVAEEDIEQVEKYFFFQIFFIFLQFFFHNSSYHNIITIFFSK